MSDNLSIIANDGETEIKTNKWDILALLTKAGSGLTGKWWAPTVAELLSVVIPNQKIDRVITWVGILEYKLKDIEADVVQQKMRTEEFTDLLEDGVIQASRALSEERKGYIASLLKNSLTDDELRHMQDKRLLELLGQINDAEVLLLQSHTRKTRYDKEFQERHKSILHPPAAHMNAAQEVIDQAAMHKQFLSHLISLELLERLNSSYQVTELGRLLLRRIDVLGAEER